MLYVSMASAWEVAIKAGMGKMPEFNGGVRSFIARLNEMDVLRTSIMPPKKPSSSNTGVFPSS